MSDRGGSNAPRRFYKSAAVEAGDDGWRVTLDGRALRTPAKNVFETPTEPLASIVAEEWAAQGETIRADTMPALRLANVAIDRTPPTREIMAHDIARYAETDLVCHLADGPEALRERQEAAWRPLRDWAGEELGVVLVPAEGVMATRQPDASLDAVRDYALTLDDFRLTGLAHATALLGSAVLGLSLEKGRVTAAEACDASLVDETFQAEKWGWDDEAKTRIDLIRAEADALGRWFTALEVD